jgi:hypothetical protein
MNHIIAMIFGILGSIQLHIAKALQSQGVKTLELLRIGNGKDSEKLKYDGRIHKSRHYIAGLILSNTGFIWIILANRFAPSSYFTSMFGIGLIFLILYADKIMGEHVPSGVYLGSFILLIGTLLIGYDGIKHDHITMTGVDNKIIVTVAAGFIFISTLFIILAKRYKRDLVTIAGGFLAGGLSCFDPIFKGLGQHKGEVASFLPTDTGGWIFFISSLIFTTYAFILCQWCFSHKARVSLFVPVFNSVYIILPILILRLALPDYHFSQMTIWGLLTIVAAMFYLTREIRNGSLLKVIIKEVEAQE